jgi:hypothetical protein
MYIDIRQEHAAARKRLRERMLDIHRVFLLSCKPFAKQPALLVVTASLQAKVACTVRPLNRGAA